MITNNILLAQIIEAQRLGVLTKDLTASLTTLAKYRCLRSPFAACYPHKEDLENEVIVRLCASWNTFDVTKSQNPLVFLITSAECAITGAISRERREQQIKKDLEEYTSTGIGNDLPNM